MTEAVLAELDWAPPTEVLAALAERTGVGLGALRTMTIAGWVPWLTDILTPDDPAANQELFDTYVRQHSVLVAPGRAGRNQVHRWRRPWLPPAGPRWEQRVCPVCAIDPERGTALMWRLPIMLSCAEHGCRLEPALEVELALVRQAPIPATPVSEHVTALDRRTHEGLSTGSVSLPGRSVHVGVWFRLLRTLLDELAIAPSRLGRHSRAALEYIWATVDRPIRAGLGVWRPFEQLDWPTQQAMLEAAALALHLAKTGAVGARGTLGAALAVQPHRPVYDGDEQAYRLRQAWNELNAMIVTARTDPGHRPARPRLVHPRDRPIRWLGTPAPDRRRRPRRVPRSHRVRKRARRHPLDGHALTSHISGTRPFT